VEGDYLAQLVLRQFGLECVALFQKFVERDLVVMIFVKVVEGMLYTRLAHDRFVQPFQRLAQRTTFQGVFPKISKPIHLFTRTYRRLAIVPTFRTEKIPNHVRNNYLKYCKPLCNCYLKYCTALRSTGLLLGSFL